MLNVLPDILRVGGRLRNAIALNIFQRNPILLPHRSVFTKLIFENEHRKIMHNGPQALLAAVRSTYWPIIMADISLGALDTNAYHVLN